MRILVMVMKCRSKKHLLYSNILPVAIGLTQRADRPKSHPLCNSYSRQFYSVFCCWADHKMISENNNNNSSQTILFTNIMNT